MRLKPFSLRRHLIHTHDSRMHKLLGDQLERPGSFISPDDDELFDLIPCLGDDMICLDEILQQGFKKIPFPGVHYAPGHMLISKHTPVCTAGEYQLAAAIRAPKEEPLYCYYADEPMILIREHSTSPLFFLPREEPVAINPWGMMGLSLKPQCRKEILLEYVYLMMTEALFASQFFPDPSPSTILQGGIPRESLSKQQQIITRHRIQGISQADLALKLLKKNLE